ncbi:quinoprotein relay system zinc metallohydrolase 1 [Algiphilus sp.]|uniref:quinoprotein relay system zinc metallohydrolase 1 n=1 Tax=Algiphilus sp. TaxID=1872431 RepID=UPI003B51B67B
MCSRLYAWLALSCATVLMLAWGFSGPSHAGEMTLDYQLSPRQIAPGVWIFEGSDGDFNRSNGGNILNTGFIETDEGAVVIDPGPTRAYGTQMRAAIAQVSDKGIARVYITHRHPDHVVGAQSFGAAPVYALPQTRAALAADGEALLDGLFRLLGDWMRDSQAVVPQHDAVPGDVRIGGRRLRLIAWGGHSGEVASDLAILDEQTGVLFAGDLVFNGRAPTTPHADLAVWRDALDAILALGPDQIVPGHGSAPTSLQAVEETREWLIWLETHLRDAAQRGVSIGEALRLPIDDRFSDWSLARHEYVRSVNHLYPAYRDAVLHWNTETASQP